MDYRELRREFGHELRLIGGIDLDALRKGKEAIQLEVKEKVPQLIADGGYIPLADGRIREDISRDKCIDMWIVSDNLRKGAALNAIQIAELLL